ncbi:hypothetical protein [Mycobacterium riyadhense]|uniref:hypothetical protein n=1 Tax=Mycobacterium riyadhense TaxID=486698 RepID=UPI0019566CCF|nr:hypothetical protein [Mycobacterium riyadhense]
MTQPNLIVQPNPERAEYLRKLQIPENMPGWTAFRDHELDVAENGIPQYRVANYTAEVVDKLVAAQLDTIAALAHFQKSMLDLGQLIDGLFYKKKEPGPTTSATAD